MKKNIIIIIISLVLVFGIGTTMAGTGDKNPFLALRKAISSLQNKDIELEKQNSGLEKKIYCLELIKKTPDRGPGEWINIDIIEFHKELLIRYEKIKTNPSRPEEQDSAGTFYEKLLLETKILYDQYLQECGDLINQ